MNLETESFNCDVETPAFRPGRKRREVLAAGLVAGTRNGADACGAGVRHSGSPGVQPAVKQELQPVTAGISAPQGGE
jgi:hypothetical protein